MPSPGITTRAAVATVVCTAGLLSGCTGGDDARPSAETLATVSVTTPSATPTTPRAEQPEPAPPPEVGECRVLSFDDTDGAVTDAATESVRCGDSHTAHTFATGRLPEGVDPGADPDRVADAVSVDCRSKLVQWLGSDETAYELSMFGYVVGVPPAEQLALGARWYRCDTYAVASADFLAGLPTTTRRALAGDGAAQWATCVAGDLTAESDQVLCRREHDWRAISAHRLGTRGDPFPGGQRVTARTSSLCEDDVSAYVSDPLTAFDYGWLRPAAPDWRQGQRFGLCFAQTAR